jgi:hypothetical protein
MSRLHLRAAPAIDDPDAGHGAGVAVSRLDGGGERPLAERPSDKLGHDPTVCVFGLEDRLLLFAEARPGRRGLLRSERARP